jgi:PAS domain S-box-containing protein
MLKVERESRETGISEVLRESEQKYHTVFEQAAIGICRVSFHGARWIEFNDAFKNMLGYTKEELLQNPWPQITHPEDVDLEFIPFRRMAAGELESYTVEKRFIHKKGHHVWARPTLSLVRNAKEEPDYEIAVVENINERKQTEESLRRLSQFPGENPHPVLRIAADSTLLYANEAASDCLAVMRNTGEDGHTWDDDSTCLQSATQLADCRK